MALNVNGAPASASLGRGGKMSLRMDSGRTEPAVVDAVEGAAGGRDTTAAASDAPSLKSATGRRRAAAATGLAVNADRLVSRVVESRGDAAESEECTCWLNRGPDAMRSSGPGAVAVLTHDTNNERIASASLARKEAKPPCFEEEEVSDPDTI
jgi:hypothetical protein